MQQSFSLPDDEQQNLVDFTLWAKKSRSAAVRLMVRQWLSISPLLDRLAEADRGPDPSWEAVDRTGRAVAKEWIRLRQEETT